MGLEHRLRFSNEDFRILLRRLPLCPFKLPRSHEHLRFWHDGADTRGEERDPRRRPEQRAPGLRDMWDEPQVDHGGDQIAHRVALLEDAARHPTHFDGQVLERVGGGEPPYAAHGDTEERANGEELVKGLHESRAELESAAEQEVHD